MSLRAAAPSRLAALSRRRLLVGAATTSAAVVAAPVVSPAEAAHAPYRPAVRPYAQTSVPSDQALLMADRFSYGYTPALNDTMNAAGGPQKWFARQLDYANVDDSLADSFSTWYPSRTASALDNYRNAIHGSGYIAEAVADHQRWTLMMRTYSNRQVYERMVDFWLNHLHVYGMADMTWFWRTSYDDTIRRHALGRFDQMLREAVVHPTMLTYLDGDLSQVVRRTTPGGQLIVTDELNENLGRELLELHTVGIDGGYTEDQVIDSARILTGYHIDRFSTWAYSYDPNRHYTGYVKVMDFESQNSELDGRPLLHDYLQYLAHHPATATRIATKLALRFVSDTPSDELIADLARVFRTSGTDIKATLRALVGHPEFAASAGQKVRTPVEDTVATIRSLGIQIVQPVADNDGANAIAYVSKTAGQVPFGWVAPNGFPDTADAWSSGGRMMASYHLHYTLAAGFYPQTGVTYRKPASWLPQKSIRFDLFVDHLCRVLHGEGATSAILGAACVATGQQPGDLITSDCVLINWRMPKLLGILLDSRQHLTR